MDLGIEQVRALAKFSSVFRGPNYGKGPSQEFIRIGPVRAQERRIKT